MKQTIVYSLIVAAFLIHSINAECINPTCNGFGNCVNDTCVCLVGWYNDPNIPQSNCETVLTELPGYGEGWNAARSILGIGFFTVGTLAVLSTISTMKSERKADTGNLVTVKIWVSVIVAFCGFDQALYLWLDPRGFGNILAGSFVKRLFSWLIWTPIFPLSVCALLLILLYWVELYVLAREKIRKNEQLKKVNSNYNVVITLEQVLKEHPGLRVTKYVFMSSAIVSLGLYFVCAFLAASNPPGFIFMAVEGVYIILNWLLIGPAFLYWSRKLQSVLPNDLAKKNQKLSWRITWMMSYGTIGLFVALAMFGFVTSPDPGVVIANLVIVNSIFIGMFALFLVSIVKVDRKSLFCLGGVISSFGSKNSGTDVELESQNRRTTSNSV